MRKNPGLFLFHAGTNNIKLSVETHTHAIFLTFSPYRNPKKEEGNLSYCI